MAGRTIKKPRHANAGAFFVVEAGGFLIIVGASLLAMVAVRYCSCTASFVSLASQLPQWLQGLLNSTRSGTRVISTLPARIDTRALAWRRTAS